jgi:NitT/TauT family transport system ATP-binding protein
MVRVGKAIGLLMAEARNTYESSGGAQPSFDVVFEGVDCVFEHQSGRLVQALDDVTFKVAEGQLVAVVGRSGHGKSTMLRVLAGLQPPTRGEVRVGAQLVTGPGLERSMVFQQDTVFPWMTVRENVDFGPRSQGVDKAQRKELSDRWLEAVQLLDFADSWPRELSGGMRKRVALAAVLATGSEVWLMDEPFGSLDYFTRRTLHDLLLELWADTKKTVFFVTHDIEEALILADRVMLIQDGKIIEDLNITLPRPRDEDVRASPEAVVLTKMIVENLAAPRERGADDARTSA